MSPLVPAVRRLKSRPLLDLVPLIDIVFQLVLFFLVSTSLVQREVFPLRLPAAESAETQGAAGLRVDLDAGGAISMNGLLVDPESLGAAFERAAVQQGGGQADSPLSLSLRADERVSYGELARVMDAARLAGFTAIELVVIGR